MSNYSFAAFAAVVAVVPALAATPLAEAAPPQARVAIIDSGIARTAELAPALVAEYDMASVPARPAFQPRYDHGTMVATILERAAKQRVTIISFRIDDPAGCPAGAAPPCQPDAAPIAAAISKAAALGVDVINISLALGSDDRITAAVRDAAARGIRVVLAAGNEGLPRPANLGPARAAFPNAVLVGALDGKGDPWAGTNRPDADAADYAYVWQRGVGVPTAGADGRPLYGTGTSFAAPIETARLLDRPVQGAEVAAVTRSDRPGPNLHASATPLSSN